MKTVVSFIWQIPVKWLFYVYLGITKLIYYSILNDRIFFILITFSNNDNERKRNISQIPIDLTVLKPPSFYDFVLNIHILMKHQKSHHFILLNQKNNPPGIFATMLL